MRYQKYRKKCTACKGMCDTLRLQAAFIFFFLFCCSTSLNAQIDLEPARTFISVTHQKPFRLEYVFFKSTVA
jgi:hypothetical protein